MAKPYSDDLRERVARSVVGGRSSRETARLFGVSVASAVKWSQRLRLTGSAASRPMGGHRKRILASQQEWLLGRLAQCPDLTVRVLAVELRGRGFEVSHSTVWSLLRSVSGRCFSLHLSSYRCSPHSGAPSRQSELQSLLASAGSAQL